MADVIRADTSSIPAASICLLISSERTASGYLRPMGKPRTPAGRAKEVASRLAQLYPEAVCELTHSNAYELLAATILSAQCTDVRVNQITPRLFALAETPKAMSRLCFKRSSTVLHCWQCACGLLVNSA